MSETALIFSGQGSQYSGMGKAIYEEDPSAYEDIFAAGGEILGFDIKKAMFEGTKEELARTSVSQPAIFTMSLLCARKYMNEGGTFTAVAGHSLGEYAAMVLSEMTDMKTGYTLIKHRAACMDKAAQKNGGKMAAIIGLMPQTVEDICKETNAAGDYVVPVNYNSTLQTVIAGSEAGVDKACGALKEAGAKRVMPLAVAAAFHSEYMKEAGLEFKELIADISFKAPKKAFYSNLLGGRLTDVSDMADILSRHIFSPVRFTDELSAMFSDGITDFVECGPGKALTGMVRKTLADVTVRTIDVNKE